MRGIDDLDETDQLGGRCLDLRRGDVVRRREGDLVHAGFSRLEGDGRQTEGGESLAGEGEDGGEGFLDGASLGDELHFEEVVAW